jgi:NAD(P)H-hydrate epimerase
MKQNAHPILSCSEALQYEASLLGGDESKTWDVMNKAGRSLGRATLRDFNELRIFPRDPHILVLAGKGHNAGDAFLAADELLKARPRGHVVVLFALGEVGLSPLAERALLVLREHSQVDVRSFTGACDVEGVHAFLDSLSGGRPFDICIDGILGMQCKPPLRGLLPELLNGVNTYPRIDFRVAVDLPTGLGDVPCKTIFRADFTYATGIAKTPLFTKTAQPYVGRIRYLDIDFFSSQKHPTSSEYILTGRILDTLRVLRSSQTDKRHYGHLFVVAGSRSYPGALMMCTKAALYGGTGLVTAFAPQHLATAFAANLPEVMWASLPETASGNLTLDVYHALLRRSDEAQAMLIGPGLGREEQTEQLVVKLLQELSCPFVLDADALVPSVLAAVKARPKHAGPVILTPHPGEFARISGCAVDDQTPEALRTFCKEYRVVTVLKGPITRISDGTTVVCSLYGGPVLARGGSGDILSGLLASRLVQFPQNPFEAACQGVVWHGQAADALARSSGQVATTTTQILGKLADVLRAPW